MLKMLANSITFLRFLALYTTLLIVGLRYACLPHGVYNVCVCVFVVYIGCYGVPEEDGGDDKSSLSSFTTTPWFCDTCKAGIDPMNCVCVRFGQSASVCVCVCVWPVSLLH